MGPTPSPFTPVQRRPRSKLLLYLAASLLRTPPKQTFNLQRGSPAGRHPVALHSRAASPSIHAPALPSRLAPAYTTKNKRSTYSGVHLMGATPSPSTPILRRAHSTLLLRLATLLIRTRQKKPFTSRRGSIPSPFTPVQPRRRSTLLLYLASLQDTGVCRYPTIWMCLASAIVFLV